MSTCSRGWAAGSWGSTTWWPGLAGARPLPRRGVLLSFGDGYRDLLTTVGPLLRERGVPAVVFAVSSGLGATNSWDTAIGASAESRS
jgi:peptidoglycan/xylan/chitin deacetylase (PgdA/CDA1 family)